MSKKSLNALITSVLGVCTVGYVAPSNAALSFGKLWENTNFSSLVRVDYAYRTTNYQNPNNQGTNRFNKIAVDRTTYTPPSMVGLPLTDGNDWNIPLPGFSDTIRRDDVVKNTNLDTNYFSIRMENEIQMKFTRAFRFVGRVRTVYDPGIYDEFNWDSLDDAQSVGIITGRPEHYSGSPNYYEAVGRNGKNLNPLEFAGRNYMVDFPALMFEYRRGSLALRAGNMQIAWGQAIFFQTLDVPNGLDLRRHLVLDRAFEEFSDKRVPKLSVRATYQMGNAVLDAYAGKFQPMIFANPNTPFNVIPSQFFLTDNYHTGGYDNKIDGGFRLKADYGNWGWQLMAVSRYNPGGQIRWDAHGKNTPLSGTLGDTASLVYTAKLESCDGISNPALCRNSANAGEVLSKTPFAAEPGGVYSANEWFWYAADVRLNGLDGFNAAVRDYPDLRDIYVTEAESIEELTNQLNTLMVAAGGSYRGAIQRDYHREEIYGFGLSYVTDSNIDLLNAIIFNLEVSYTPERAFTNSTLAKDPIKSEEWIGSLVVEKWTRWSADYPAAYLVAQYQHRSESDIVGRHLSGYGGSQTKIADGIDSANYVVLAALQPFPGRKYELELALLYDVKGGMLFQPNFRWNIGHGFGVEMFYNYINGELHGERNDNLLSSADWAEELTVRARYTF